MDITTNNNIYSSVAISQTASNTQNTNSTFNTLVNTQEQEAIPISKMPRTPKIIEFLDRYNKFSTLSPTDEKIFKDILSDNKLTKEEANSLTYEQVEKISNLLTTNLPLNKEEFDAMPIVQMGVDLIATRATGNREFNEAFYNTLKQLDDNDASILRGEVDNNLGQLYLGKELKATFEYWGSYLANPWEYEKMDANFGKFIKDVINHHEAIINNPKVIDVIKPQFQKIVDVYKVLEKNYNEIINNLKKEQQMSTNSVSTSVNTINQTSNSFSKTSNVDKAKSDDFENYIASKKNTTQSNSNTKTENKTEIIEEKDSTQKLYDDIISLLRTGFTKDEIKAFEDRLKEILKMKKDGKPAKEIQAALKQLSMEILEAKKRVMGQVVKKADDSTAKTSATNTTSTEGITTFDKTIADMKTMIQDIKNSSKNTDINDKKEQNDEVYDRLRMLLKMS